MPHDKAVFYSALAAILALSAFASNRLALKTTRLLSDSTKQVEHLEAETANLRRQLENSTASLKDAKSAYEALRREHRAASNGWDAAQAESTRKGQELAAVTAELEHLRQRPAGKPTEATATGLTFPYVTKDLEAMRAAVAMYWEGYTPDKSQPSQKAIGHTLGELLGLPPQANGDPARKAINLATAIKPDTLPDA